MKVQNTTIFMGDVLGNNDRSQGLSGNSGEKGGRQSIFAGDLSRNFDPVAQKQQSARKKVMKIVGDAWASDQTLTDEMENARVRMEESKKAMKEAGGEIKWAEEERVSLRESYGVEADSREEQDLKLLEKEHTARTFGGESLSKEERERLAQIHEEGLTEYQQRSMELYEGEDYYKKQLNEMKAANDSVSTIRSAMAKNQTMIKAQNTAEQIKESASKDIIGILVDEAKDHIDEEMEEKKEEALEKAEKDKEEQEKIDKVKEDKEEQEEFAEQVADSTQLLTEADSAMEEAQRAIKKMMDEMKLLEEDIKGAAVDASM